MKTQYFKRLWSWMGVVLVVLSLVIIGKKVLQSYQELGDHAFQASMLLAVTPAIILWGLGLFFLSRSWALLLDVRPNTIGKFELEKQYITANIFKYLPGNILHYVARHSFGRRFDLGHGHLLTSIPVEALGLVWSALFFSTLSRLPPPSQMDVYFYLPASGLLILPLIGLGLGRFALKYGHLPQRPLPQWAKIGLGYLLFMAFLLGGSWIVALGTGLGSAITSQIAGFYLLAWVSGYVMPGAPAGLGVREAAFILFTESLAPQDILLIFLGLMRAINIAADGLTFIIARPILTYLQKSTTDDETTTSS